MKNVSIASIRDGRLLQYCCNAGASVGVTTSLFGLASGVSAGEIVHNGITYGVGETLSIQLTTGVTTWSVDFDVRTPSGSGYQGFWVGGLSSATGSPGPGVQLAPFVAQTSSISSVNNGPTNWSTHNILAIQTSDGQAVPNYGFLGSGIEGYIVVADMRFDGTYFDYVQYAWIHVSYDESSQVLAIGDSYMSLPSQSAVPGVSGIAVLACGAAGLRRTRQRTTADR